MLRACGCVCVQMQEISNLNGGCPAAFCLSLLCLAVEVVSESPPRCYTRRHRNRAQSPSSLRKSYATLWCGLLPTLSPKNGGLAKIRNTLELRAPTILSLIIFFRLQQ